MSITNKQREFRKGKLGSSDAAAALGVSYWTSPAQLYHQIIGNLEKPDLGEKGEIGNDMEYVIHRAYERRTGRTLAEDPTSYVHPKYPWMVCHIDRWDEQEQAITEMKNVGFRVAHLWGEDGEEDGVPKDVMAQAVMQANIVSLCKNIEVRRVYVCGFFGGNELRVYPLEIGAEAKKAVEDGLVRFWTKHVEPRKQPNVTEVDEELMKSLYPRTAEQKTVWVSSTKTAIGFEDYRAVKREIKELEKKALRYKVSIQDMMGDAAAIKRAGEPDTVEFTWTNNNDTLDTDWMAVAHSFYDYLSRGHLPDSDGGYGQGFYHETVAAHTKTIPGPRVFRDKQMD